jgi:hypothetical protein
MTDRLPAMGARMPYNLPLNWSPGTPNTPWHMTGYYQTTTSSMGNSRLNVYGELVGEKMDMGAHAEYISYVVLGTES